jgi:hypothetical protein
LRGVSCIQDAAYNSPLFLRTGAGVTVATVPLPPPPGWLPDRELSSELLRLRALALEWISPYYDGEHLARAGDWLLAVAPDAPEPVIIAALTHDMERTVPGGPTIDKREGRWDDPEYNRLHCERSADVVAGWLRENRADASFVDGVRVPILEHEFGGSPLGDLAQAADSLSWLEVNARLASEWVQRGETSLDHAVAKLDWMRDRIRLPRAAELAGPMHRRAVADLVAARS